MKVIGRVESASVVDVRCDICGTSTRMQAGGYQFGTLQAHWGYGTRHDGERYEVHLCEDCFFQALANHKGERRAQIMFSEGALEIPVISASWAAMIFSKMLVADRSPSELLKNLG